MRQALMWILVCALGAVPSASAAGSSPSAAQDAGAEASRSGGPNVDDVLARLAAALGGRDRLARIHGSYSRATIEAAGLRGTAEQWETTRGQSKTTFDLGVVAGETVFDGSRGWSRDQNGKVRELSTKELQDAVTSAYMTSYSFLVAGRMPGRVEFAGEDSARASWVLRILPAGGKPVTLYVDKTSYLPAKAESRSDERVQTTTYSDWRDVDGVKVPFQSRQGTGDPKYDTVATLAEVRFDVPIAENAFARPADASLAKAAPVKGATGIPFELTSNHIYLKVRVNGSEPLWFLLDTGAERSVVDMDRAKKLGLSLQGAVEARGGGAGSLQAALIPELTFDLSGVEVASKGVVAIPLAGIAPFEGRNMDGILGYDFISRFVVEIDYAASRLALHDPASYAYTGNGEELPIELDSSIPHVRARLGGPGREPIEGLFTVDTGARSALTLSRPFVEGSWLKDVAQKGILATYGIGVGGETRSRVARLGSLQLGRYTVENVVAGFALDEGGAHASSDINGNIGGEVLRRFKVVFDYSRARMILEPNSHFGTPQQYDALGALLRLDAQDGPAFRIVRVVDGSAAAAAGLREGDAIVSVDGRAAAAMTLEEARRLFRSEGVTVKLSVRRDGAVRDVSVTLRKLV